MLNRRKSEALARVPKGIVNLLRPSSGPAQLQYFLQMPQSLTILESWQKNIRMLALLFGSFLKRTRPMGLKL